MQIKFNDILELFELVNFGSPFDNGGYICTLTGQTYFHSHFGDNEEPLPGDIDDNKYLSIPHKQDLNLGINIALDFTHAHLPTAVEQVNSIFHRKGAYANFKSLLDKAGNIEAWYKYEAMRTEQALRLWCAEQNLDIID